MGSSSVLTSIIRNAGRVLAIVLGAASAAVVPAILWADDRQQANAAAGHLPNMDPFVVVFLAAIFVALIVFVVLLVELVRSWVYERRPLNYVSCLVLGAASTWPVGADIWLRNVSLGREVIAFASVLSVIVFYLVRWKWSVRRGSVGCET